MDLKNLFPHLKDEDIFRHENDYMFSNPIRRFFQRLLDRRILGQIEPLIVRARVLGLPEKDIKEALVNLEYHEPEVAFVVIVEQMSEFEIKIDQEFYDLAMNICDILKLEKHKYHFLERLLEK